MNNLWIEGKNKLKMKTVKAMLIVKTPFSQTCRYNIHSSFSSVFYDCLLRNLYSCYLLLINNSKILQ